jgi:hypothetical protein
LRLHLYRLLLILACISLHSCNTANDSNTKVRKNKPSPFPTLSDKQIKKRLSAETQRLKLFLNTHPQYNQDICMMVDMKQMSG